MQQENLIKSLFSFEHNWWNIIDSSLFLGFPGGSDGKESACNGKEPSLGQKDPLEKEMVTHSNTLAWRIPWREEPGGLKSMVSQRVRHNRVTNTFTNIINGKQTSNS